MFLRHISVSFSASTLIWEMSIIRLAAGRPVGEYPDLTNLEFADRNPILLKAMASCSTVRCIDTHPVGDIVGFVNMLKTK